MANHSVNHLIALLDTDADSVVVEKLQSHRMSIAENLTHVRY